MPLNSQRMRSELRKAIAQTFLPFAPDRIVLFGSHARRDSDEYSDIDLIIRLAAEDLATVLEVAREFLGGSGIEV